MTNINYDAMQDFLASLRGLAEMCGITVIEPFAPQKEDGKWVMNIRFEIPEIKTYTLKPDDSVIGHKTVFYPPKK